MSNQNAMVSFEEMQLMAKAFSASGFFKDASDQAKAIVKIAYGRELGIAPVAAMCGIYLTAQGKLELDSGLIGALIKGSERYNYFVKRLDGDGCEIEFYENGKLIGTSSFDVNDAKRAGLAGKDTYGKYPRNLYFARALTNGARWYCPNIFGGAVYASGEIEPANAPRETETKTVNGETVNVETGEIKQEGNGNGHAAQAASPQPPQPVVDMNLKPGGVEIPSHKTNAKTGGNGNTKRATLRTNKLPELVERMKQQEYIAPDATIANEQYHIAAIAFNAGIETITDANLEQVWNAIEAHCEAKFAEQAEAAREAVA